MYQQIIEEVLEEREPLMLEAEKAYRIGQELKDAWYELEEKTESLQEKEIMNEGVSSQLCAEIVK